MTVLGENRDVHWWMVRHVRPMVGKYRVVVLISVEVFILGRSSSLFGSRPAVGTGRGGAADPGLPLPGIETTRYPALNPDK